MGGVAAGVEPRGTAPRRKTFKTRTVVALSAALAIHYAYIHVFKTHEARAPAHTSSRSEEAAAHWADDVWPFREQEPWDISRDLEHPRKVTYEVSEGTWLRLDVHPTSGEIVFDMLGDLYCLAPPSTRARAITRGVPHDADPHFSPSGEALVFRSDAGLGLDNIWVMPWSDCATMALVDQLHDAESGGPETPTTRARRLRVEGRAGAVRVTNETYRYITDARWHPAGDRVVATKWYTGRITIGGGEGWEYPLPSLSTPQSPGSVKVASGRRLVERNLPPAWPVEDYNLNPVGPEQFIWAGDDALIYSMNTADDQGVYNDNKDVHKGIYSIFYRNISTSQTQVIVPASPGGASRPELSRDGRTLAFVRRVRDKQALVVRDMHSGTLRNIWYGLTYDAYCAAPMGTYPSFAFSPNDTAIIIWAAGHIWRVPLAVDALSGERVLGGEPTRVPFTAHVEKQLAETLRPTTNITVVEAAPLQRVYAMKDLDVDARGKRVVFSAAGATYVHTLGAPAPELVSVLDAQAAYYAPSFSPAGDRIVHVRWNDLQFSTIEISVLGPEGKTLGVTGLPWHIGRYHAPALCACGKHIAFARMPGEVGSGHVVAIGSTGIYIATLNSDSGVVHDVHRVSDALFEPELPLRLRFAADSCNELLVRTADRAFTLPAHSTVARAHMAQEVAVAGAWVAWVERMQVYVAPLAATHQRQEHGAWAHPRFTTPGAARLSISGGHDIVFSSDGARIFWLAGPRVHSLALDTLLECQNAIQRDTTTHGVDCLAQFVDSHELVVEYEADSARIRQDAHQHARADLDAPNADVLVLANATLVTMQNGLQKTDIVRHGTLVMQGGLIRAVGTANAVEIPVGAHVIDVHGGYVLPGFIDTHAHWARSFTYPLNNWMYAAMLAYGVTTVHNPSHHAVGGYYERFLLERRGGLGPRIFQTGEPLFGSEGWPEIHSEIVDMREARDALQRLRDEGGPSSFSYKNYQLPSRAARQRLLVQARNMSMIGVPEGVRTRLVDMRETYLAE